MTAHTHTDNIFSKTWNTPHGTVPFDLISIAQMEQAILEGIKREDAEIEAIVHNTEAPSFENTIVPLDAGDDMLSWATTVMYNLSSAETNDELDDLVQRMAPLLAEHNANISLNAKLFERIKAVYEQRDAFDGEDRMLLEKTYEGFERSGATLEGDDRRHFREITQELSQLTVTFSQNLLKDTNAYELHVTDLSALSGLPQSQLEQAAAAAAENGRSGWFFTLKAPSYVPFMTYADNRKLRKEMYMAYLTRCTHPDAQNNFEVVRRIVNLRREMAQLLGYKTYADYALRRRMAQQAEHVYDLLDNLLSAYKPHALEEVAEVEKMAKKTEGDAFTLQPWDWAYYSHKLKMEKYNLDAEMLRPYFELSRVKKGVFGLATTLYGITFKQNPDIPVYHPDVDAFEVFDADGSFLAVLYCDFHPRRGKQGGAWMTSYKEQWRDESGDSRPHVSLVMNLTKPTADKPALLTLGEVETFLHEFGHALHGIFAATKYRSLSGTNVYWDFVELPSQFMENYAVEPAFLQTFAQHYETGEPLPDSLIERVKGSRNFNVAYACLRQVSFGLLDMAYYTMEQPLEGDIRSFEQQAWSSTQLLPCIPETCMSVQFGHIMSGGYAAGYYSYKWAEVLDADAFSLFKENGIFSRDTAQKFRDNILSLGGTENPELLYERFRGRKPTIEALMQRDGIKPCSKA